MLGLNFWQIVGLALLLWFLYDLVVGYTYSYRLVLRKAEPLHYWLTLALWLTIAVLTFLWG